MKLIIHTKATQSKTSLKKLSKVLNIARQKEIDSLCAYELGYLDAKHDMGYQSAPRKKDEASYSAGYKSVKTSTELLPILSGTYFEKANWGWY